MQGTIKSNKRIDWLFKNGSRFFGAGFFVVYAPRDTTEGVGTNERSEGSVLSASGRLAFVAGKKLGSAPLRSRAKRRLREAARAAGAPWEGFDVVFIAKAGLQKQEFTRLVADIKRLENKLPVLPPCPEEPGKKDPSYGVAEEHGAVQEKQGCEQAATRQQKPYPFAFIISIPKKLALLCISIYRHAISPLLPPSCRYVPTCSEYAMIAFERFGFLKGLVLTTRRVGRCHPFAQGGYDPVPENVDRKLV